ncbi:uncharacterized protein LOC121403130 [Xenopus laevis]|uniref:ribonuclease H n=1 Tax=Xenopus laevis TaxID=8355 RepID=A0A8J1N0T7_XENLA|nr:uncharacterized protein LOC121403130 [Xenopus laevis]XP_041446856.1 uncharacterized protein LOC121403130 [Xenopus laevis]
MPVTIDTLAEAVQDSRLGEGVTPQLSGGTESNCPQLLKNPPDDHGVMDARVGARLSRFYEVWKQSISDQWVLDLLKRGYRIEFLSVPTLNFFLVSPMPRGQEKKKALEEYVQILLDQEVVVPVPQEEREKGIYSLLFLVKKASGGWRPVLDLKKLNSLVHLQKFKMESINTIIAAVQAGDWLLSIDLKDAYLHLPIADQHQRFLRFAVGHRHFQFRALPFGLSTSPRTFSKVLITLVAELRKQGLTVWHYLDDILLSARSPEVLLLHREIAISFLQSHGWLINWEKSQLQPSQSLIYLGALFNTADNVVQLPQQKIERMVKEMEDFCLQGEVSARRFMSLLGLMAASIPMTKWARFHMREAQRYFLTHWNRWEINWNQLIPLSPELKVSLQWWMNPSNLSRGFPLAPINWRIITTDASSQGWGALLESSVAQGIWKSPLKVHANVLELRAVFQALQAFAPDIKGMAVKVKGDNSSAVSYIRKQGGTKSLLLWKAVCPILSWAEQNLENLTAVHVPGILNQKADFLSRMTLSKHEWKLHPDIFPPASREVGSSGSGPHGLSGQCSTADILCKIFQPSSSGDRCTPSALVVPSSLCVPTNPSPPSSPTEGDSGGSGAHPRGPLLASSTMVSSAQKTGSSRPVADSCEGESTDPGTSGTSRPTLALIDGMEIERKRLVALGLSEAVVATLLRARKSNTSTTYYKIWERFLLWQLERANSCFPPPLPQVLEFLQEGLSKGLQYRTLKVHVAALSAMTGIRWAEDPLVKRFFSATLKICPPKRTLSPAWDLPMVLKALCEHPFEPLQEASLWLVTLKTLFLVAIVSAARVSLLHALSVEEQNISFWPDKVILKPPDSFLPKVVSTFHLAQDIIIPIIPEEPNLSSKLQKLDPVRMLKHYLAMTQSLRKSGSLFVIPAGPRKGEQPAKSTIARWIVILIQKSYNLQGKQAPAGLKAHSTRAVATSWAAEAEVSESAICETAVWSSARTFFKFYRLNVKKPSQHNFASAVLRSFSVN